jgi:hypothetical protein
LLVTDAGGTPCAFEFDGADHLDVGLPYPSSLIQKAARFPARRACKKTTILALPPSSRKSSFADGRRPRGSFAFMPGTRSPR